RATARMPTRAIACLKMDMRVSFDFGKRGFVCRKGDTAVPGRIPAHSGDRGVNDASRYARCEGRRGQETSGGMRAQAHARGLLPRLARALLPAAARPRRRHLCGHGGRLREGAGAFPPERLTLPGGTVPERTLTA